MERQRYVLRDETFGGTLFDRKLLKHQFFKTEDIQAGILVEGHVLDNYEHWVAETKGLPKISPIHLPEYISR